MQGRLPKARDLLEKAWKAEPTYTRTAEWMINVSKGLGLDRDETEKWFRRAMDADPDNWEACSGKMEYVHPKWYGTDEELEEFAQQCYATHNWYARITLLSDYSFTYADAAKIMLPAFTEYLKAEGVWGRYVVAYEPYLFRYPDDIQVRTRYAVLSVSAGKLDVAKKQFEALKGRPWTPMFKSQKAY